MLTKIALGIGIPTYLVMAWLWDLATAAGL